jgi:hypothetical protein
VAPWWDDALITGTKRERRFAKIMHEASASGPAIMHAGNPGARGSKLPGPETGTSGTAARDPLALALDVARLGAGVALAITVARAARRR